MHVQKFVVRFVKEVLVATERVAPRLPSTAFAMRAFVLVRAAYDVWPTHDGP
jgi:hypothetical protein